MRILFFFLIAAFSSIANSQSSLLVVNAKFDGYMGLLEENDCSKKDPVVLADGSEEVCVNWSGWVKYTGRVTSVLKGEVKEKKITFALLQHSRFNKDALKELYIVVTPFKDERLPSLTESNYRVLDWGLPEKVVCFNGSLKESMPSAKVKDPDYIYSKDPEDHVCYLSDELRR